MQLKLRTTCALHSHCASFSPIQKALEKGFSKTYGPLGVGWPPTKVIQLAKWTNQGFWVHFPDLQLYSTQTQVLVTVSGSRPRATSKTLHLGQTKAGNGFSTLEVGWQGVDTPIQVSVGVGSGPS